MTDTAPVPGIEWRLEVDREQAGRFGADIATVGNAVQLVTNGILIGDYRPGRRRRRGRHPRALPGRRDRSLEQLERLRVNTRAAARCRSATSSTRTPAPQRRHPRADSTASACSTVAADVEDGVLADDKVQEIRAWLAEQRLRSARSSVAFKGEDEEQREAQAFLSQAFAVALFLIAIILVTQFNSFYQSLLILSAVVFSTVGVLLGLLITEQPFGIVMSGIGVIALAGIVVNNNIVLIDTYNELRKRGLAPYDAVLRTGAQRLRPVLLTTVTTVLGLLADGPQAQHRLGRAHDHLVGGPSTDWWAQLASAVAGGLTFATLLTLVLTPCLLLLGARASSRVAARRARSAARLAAGRLARLRAATRRVGAAGNFAPPATFECLELETPGSWIMAADRIPGMLNQLIAVCRDAEELYGYAARKADGSELQPLLHAAAGLHREIGDALRPHVSGAGVPPAEGGTLAGKLRQFKGGLKATFAADPEFALLPELQDTEEAVVQAFEGALAEPLDPAAKTVVARRLGVLRATQDRIADLAERAAA